MEPGVGLRNGSRWLAMTLSFLAALTRRPTSSAYHNARCSKEGVTVPVLRWRAGGERVLGSAPGVESATLGNAWFTQPCG